VPISDEACVDSRVSLSEKVAIATHRPFVRLREVVYPSPSQSLVESLLDPRETQAKMYAVLLLERASKKYKPNMPLTGICHQRTSHQLSNKTG
jgi:hypothetical protein